MLTGNFGANITKSIDSKPFSQSNERHAIIYRLASPSPKAFGVFASTANLISAPKTTVQRPQQLQLLRNPQKPTQSVPQTELPFPPKHQTHLSPSRPAHLLCAQFRNETNLIRSRARKASVNVQPKRQPVMCNSRRLLWDQSSCILLKRMSFEF